MKIRDARRGRIAAGAIALAMLGSLIVLPGATAAPTPTDPAVTSAALPTAPVVDADTEWKYLDDNTDPATQPRFFAARA